MVQIGLHNMNELETQSQITQLLTSTQRILYILESDDKTKSKGLVEKVDDMQDHIDDIIINNKAKNIFYGAGAGLAITIIAWFLKFVITKEL